MTNARIDFAALGARARIEPVVLVAGCPVVFTVAGTVPTSVAVSSGAVDGLWWPGTGTLTETLPGGASWDPVRDLLDPSTVWSFRTALELVKGDVKVEPAVVDLFDRSGLATEILSRRAAAVGQLLAAELSDTATTATLSATVSFAAGGGVAHCGREAIGYTGKTSSTLTGLTRGLYGSTALPHRLGSARGSSDPLVTAGTLPRYLQGRRATVWLCRVDGTTLYDPTLIFTGLVGAGVTLVRGGTRWQLTLDPLTEVLARAPDLPVELYGWHHANALNGDLCPLYAQGAGLDINVNGGWTQSLAAVEALWNHDLATVAGVRLSVTDGRLRVTSTGAYTTATVRSWMDPHELYLAANAHGDLDAAPDTMLVMEGYLKLAANDFARVPSTLSYSVSTPAEGSAHFALIADTDETEHFAAYITTRDAGTNTIQLAARSTERAVARIRAARITERTTAKVGIIAAGSNAVGPLKALAVALAQLGAVDDFASAVDWDRIAAVFRSVPTVGLPEGRAYEIGSGDDTLLTLLADEARLRGCALTVRHGLVSVIRAASFAASEAVGVTEITSTDVLTDGGTPVPYEVLDQPEPPATSIGFELRDGTILRYTDDTFAQEFGTARVTECRALKWLAANATLRGGAPTALAQAAQQILGLLAEPQRIVRLTLGQRFLGLEPGDLVLLTHDEIPSWDGTRGVDDAVCQVEEVSREIFGGKARATVSLRLGETGIGGYAPAALVAAGGLTGGSAAVTLDTSSGFGTSCFAPIGESPTYGFEVGDVVLLSQYDARTITVAEVQRTVVSVNRTAHTITMDSAPSAGLVTQAAAAYGVVIRTAPWTQATAVAVGDIPAQQGRFAFVANDTTNAFSDSSAAKRFAP